MGKVISNGTRGNVLLVEDEDETATITTTMLREEGFSVYRVSNGQEALERIANVQEPDVILLDMNMPVLDGNGFMQAYKGNAIIVVWTAWAKPTFCKKPFCVLKKPAKIDRVIAAINEALDSRPRRWSILLPCKHKHVGLTMAPDKDVITMSCLVCGQSKATDMNELDVATIMELLADTIEDSKTYHNPAIKG